MGRIDGMARMVERMINSSCPSSLSYPSCLLALALLFSSVTVAITAQAPPVGPPPVPYGTTINLETAKRVVAAAAAEARRNNWTMAMAIVDPAGDLVYLEKMDGTQVASPNIAIDKARSAARFKRPTKAFQDVVAAGGEGLRILGLQGAVFAEGGMPIIVDGKIVGAIGVSGGTGQQDTQCAVAAMAALK
jgi:glc operon protein GlcG